MKVTIVEVRSSEDPEALPQVKVSVQEEHASSISSARIPPKKKSGLSRFFQAWFKNSARDDNSLKRVYQQKLSRLRQERFNIGVTKTEKENMVLDELIRYFEDYEEEDLHYADLHALEQVVINYMSPEELASEEIYLKDRLLRLGFTTKEIEDAVSKIRLAKTPESATITEVAALAEKLTNSVRNLKRDDAGGKS